MRVCVCVVKWWRAEWWTRIEYMTIYSDIGKIYCRNVELGDDYDYGRVECWTVNDGYNAMREQYTLCTYFMRLLWWNIVCWLIRNTIHLTIDGNNTNNKYNPSLEIYQKMFVFLLLLLLAQFCTLLSAACSCSDTDVRRFVETTIDWRIWGIGWQWLMDTSQIVTFVFHIRLFRRSVCEIQHECWLLAPLDGLLIIYPFILIKFKLITLFVSDGIY